MTHQGQKYNISTYYQNNEFNTIQNCSKKSESIENLLYLCKTLKNNQNHGKTNS